MYEGSYGFVGEKRMTVAGKGGISFNNPTVFTNFVAIRFYPKINET